MSAAANNLCVCGQYTLLGRLGVGGRSEVWRARDHARGSEIALKILDPEFARKPGAWDALQREYAIASRLDHPFILKLYPPERDEAVVALPMEFAPGGDLRRLRSVSYLEIVPVLLEVATALEHMHGRGVVHRDLKAANVLFDARGHVRVADFGVSARLPARSLASPERGDSPSAVAGTATEAAAAEPAASRAEFSAGHSPFTASPEQLRGAPPAVSDDVYGLGALAYELLSGHPPHHPHFELQRMLEEPVPRLEPAHQAPGRLMALVMAMLSKHAERRPSCMGEIIDSLEAALNDTLELDATAPAIRPRESVASRRRDSVPAREPALGTRATGDTWDTPDPARAASSRRASRAVAADPDPAPATEGANQPLAAAAAVSSPTPAPSPPPPSNAVPTASPPPVLVPASTPNAAPADMSESALFAAFSAPRNERARVDELQDLWAEMRADPLRGSGGRKTRGASRSAWPWALVAGLAIVLAIALTLAPHGTGAVSAGGAQVPAGAPVSASAPARSPAELSRAIAHSLANTVTRLIDVPLHALASLTAPPAPVVTEAEVRASRTRVDAQRAALDAHGAETWGGADYAQANAREAEASGAEEAGNRALALRKLSAAGRLLDAVGKRAPAELTAQVAAGNQALDAGKSAAASRAFDLAAQIDPTDPRVVSGLKRARTLGAVQPLLVDGLSAEAGRQDARAERDYEKVLSLDAGNADARAGLRRARAALDAALYQRDVRKGLAALGSNRLEAARTAFEHALRLDHRGVEALAGLDRVDTALQAQHSEAASVSASEASAVSSRATVHVALISDNLTQVTIPKIGSFGTFSRREIDLKPGTYTVIGTRTGYRAVRRNVTIEPGEELQTISVRCEEPI